MSGPKRELTFRHKWVLEVGGDGSISGAARLLAIMAIMKFGKPDQGEPFWPSHASLASLIDKSERTARRQMAEVAKAGWIEVRHRDGTSNLYVPKMRTLDTPDRGTPDKTDRGGWPEMAYEQLQEHTHSEQVHSPAPDFPCFEHGVPGCDCRSPEVVKAAEVEMCNLHGSFTKDGCTYCARPKIESKLPEFKQRQLWEKHNEAEGLSANGSSRSGDHEGPSTYAARLRR